MQHSALTQPNRAQASENWGGRWLDAMAAGDFEAAWRASDRVLALRDPETRDDPSLPYHLRWVWDGRPVDGRRVLVRCYHGLGDTLQFCRYLPALRRRAAEVVVEAQPALLPALAAVGGADRLVPFRPDAPLPQAECDVEIMELAHALRLRPDPAPYLPVGAPVRSGPVRVGVCWQVNASWQPERSVPTGLLECLGAVPGITLHSLQQGTPTALPGAHGEPCPADVLDTARLIAGLDLVVSVDTIVAHLAGAVGTELWLLLPAEPDWRWRAGGRGSPWYQSVRKYQQARPGAWDAPVAALLADLARVGAAGTLATHIGS